MSPIVSSCLYHAPPRRGVGALAKECVGPGDESVAVEGAECGVHVRTETARIEWSVLAGRLLDGRVTGSRLARSVAGSPQAGSVRAE